MLRAMIVGFLFFGPYETEAGITILGSCDASLERSHGFVKETIKPKVGAVVRVFTQDKKWVPLTVHKVDGTKIHLQTNAGQPAILDLNLQGHYVDLRDPAKYPETLKHPLTFGLKLGGRVTVQQDTFGAVHYLYVAAIDIYAQRFLATPTLPTHLQDANYAEDPRDLMLAKYGFGFSVPFDSKAYTVPTRHVDP
jgi:hypothetical protein